MPSAQYRAVCFTINNPADDSIDFPDYVRYAVWQKEKVSTEHLQGYAELSDKKSLSALKKWLPTAHFEPRKGTRDQARDYCMKDESRIAGPWEHGTFSTEQGKRSDIVAARDLILSGATKRKVLDDMPEILAKYPKFVDLCLKEAARDSMDKPTLPKPHKWQQDVLDLLKLPADPRQIVWIYDSEGGKGKTHLAKYIVGEFGAFYCRGGKTADIAYAYNYEKIVLFDYTRDHEEYVNYGVLEMFKDGMVVSSKYESTLKMTNPPHVIVFSNFEPDRTKMSADRWNIININPTLGGLKFL